MLNEISAEFADSQPFAGMTIGTGIHLEPKTVALLLTPPSGWRDRRVDRQPELNPADGR
jgi:adenosylhomocysteinase